MLLIPLFIFFGCSKSKIIQILESNSDLTLDTNLSIDVIPEQLSFVEESVEESMEEKKKQFENITILDIIDIYINNKWFLNVGSDDKNYLIHLGYFQFLSRESIQWYLDTSGYRFFSYLYIIDENNLRIEILSFFGSAEEARIGNYCAAQKYYIDINTNQLVDYYFKTKYQFESYIITEYFKVNLTEEQEKERNGYFFEVLKNTPVYTEKTIQGEEAGIIHSGDMVKVIDMHYQNLSDRYPITLKIETEKFVGWIDVDIIDFIYQ